MKAHLVDIDVNLALRPLNRSKRSVLLEAAQMAASSVIDAVLEEQPSPVRVRIAVQIAEPVTVAERPKEDQPSESRLDADAG